eukprot:gene7387-11709_t
MVYFKRLTQLCAGLIVTQSSYNYFSDPYGEFSKADNSMKLLIRGTPEITEMESKERSEFLCRKLLEKEQREYCARNLDAYVKAMSQGIEPKFSPDKMIEVKKTNKF